MAEWISEHLLYHLVHCLSANGSESRDDLKSNTTLTTPRERTPQQHAANSKQNHSNSSPTSNTPKVGPVTHDQPQAKGDEHCTAEKPCRVIVKEEQKKGAFEPEYASQWALFIAALIAAFVAAFTLRAINNQVRVAAMHYALTVEDHVARHAPKIAVRRVTIHQQANALEVRFVVMNVGQGRGRIIETGATLWLPESWPARVPDIRDIQQRNEMEANRGFEEPFSHSINDSALIQNFGLRMSPPVTPDMPIIIFGRVVYVDNNGRRYQTGFMRRYDPSAMRFMPVNDPDYEYQD